MKFHNIANVAFLSTILQVSFAHASAIEQVAVLASIEPAKQRQISLAIDSRAATANLKAQTQNPKSKHFYWFDRNASETYHATLENFRKADASAFTGPDLDHLAGICTNFSSHAKKLQENKQKHGVKAYIGNGYQLRLFVHYTDGTHAQFKPSTVGALLNSTKDVAYANVVLKLGTHGGLKKDWEDVRSRILNRPKHADFTTGAHPDLETHITIGSIFKYTQQQNEIKNGKIQRKNGRSAFNTPFLSSLKFEMKMLVDTFNSINTHMNSSQLQGIHLDRLQVTSKAPNGGFKVEREVKFS